MCLAQRQPAVAPVRLELTIPRSRDKHSTTEPVPQMKKLNTYGTYVLKYKVKVKTIQTKDRNWSPNYVFLNLFVSFYFYFIYLFILFFFGGGGGGLVVKRTNLHRKAIGPKVLPKGGPNQFRQKPIANCYFPRGSEPPVAPSGSAHD